MKNLEEIIKYYRENPIEFIEDIHGVKLDWYQKILFKYWYGKKQIEYYNKMFDK